MKKGYRDHDLEIMNKYGNVVGYYEASVPLVLVKDVNFLKSILIKDFGKFVNRRVSFLLNNKIHLITNNSWKLRSLNRS